ncbi:ion transporter [Psychrobium sp. 1_MG-2023]|uniref:ion transporter n=1 Tax=Psychrobium sp. 1_MG-2023 TaxID=3062624 RepID=UPI000C346BB8|nr:ion transporter [Psychrobium sp. 1_MG-2023]MDP2562240.1 ion transporter [Psychrobium sp. 1_MG-2023]PKF57492.1 two pore domain potassium channel family protein [Alteromonadales bacterium alter-6D02]
MDFLHHIDEYGVKNYKTRYLALMVMVVIYCVIAVGAGLLIHFESANPDANIHSYAQAFWVLIMASSTIGFGDFYPTTTGGYVIVTLMFYIGVGMMGYIGALIASKIMGFSDTNVKNRELRHQNAAILEELQAMRKELAQQRTVNSD